MAKAIVDVAIAILLHKSKVLVGWRQADQHQGNKHEFPGGKVELGESHRPLVIREIYEEVGIGLKESGIRLILFVMNMKMLLLIYIFFMHTYLRKCSIKFINLGLGINAIN